MDSDRFLDELFGCRATVQMTRQCLWCRRIVTESDGFRAIIISCGIDDAIQHGVCPECQQIRQFHLLSELVRNAEN